jgi:predicted  nucleic acid-binding Zn-ribbon protein
VARLDHFTALYEEQAKTIRELKALLKTTQDELKEALEAQASFNAVTSENQAANEKLAEQVKKLQSTVDSLVKLMGAAMSRPTLATVAEGLFVIILCISG